MSNFYGKFIVIEGVDGSGKTTICYIIKKILHKYKILNKYVREPGSTPLSEKLRSILKSNIKEKIYSKTELLIFYAARYQLLKNVIIPSLKKGIWIISDRYDLSSKVYQNLNNNNTNLINNLQTNLLNNIVPNITLYIDVNPKIALLRLLKKNKDNLEKNMIDNHKIYNIIKKYKELIFNDPKVIMLNNNYPKDLKLIIPIIHNIILNLKNKL